ncbi:MAG: hypothetical protein LQ339_006502 [Xanthoria mediterranea]|nr:MAG: hypothetical protein LQ339_006502 [Xanthoria mediterranea]
MPFLQSAACSAIIPYNDSTLDRPNLTIRRIWYLPHIKPPYPAVQQSPPLDLHTIAQAKWIPRITDRMSRLSFSDKCCCPSTRWSRLEALPPEIFSSILIHLAFFDQKALSSTSWRVYSLVGPIKPPDRFAWRLHLCSAFNRCTDDFFDITLFKPDDITRELTRITQQFSKTPTKGHYALDTTKTRLRDLTCLYFPSGFYVQYGNYKLVCRTLGHFVAIQFRSYVARLLQETKDGQDSAFSRRYIDPRIDFTQEHKETLTNETHRWGLIQAHWLKSYSAPKSDLRPDGLTLPCSAVEATEALVQTLGLQLMDDQVHPDEQRWLSAENCCTKIHSTRTIQIPMLFADNNVDMDNDVETVVEGDEPSGDENAALYEGGDEYMMGLM